MKSKFKISALFFLFLLFNQLSAQIPDGGIRLNAETGTTYLRNGNCTITETSVSDQDFTEALKVTVGSEIVNTWDAQVQFPAIAGIETGDVLFVAFYARTISSMEETGEGNVTVVVENNSSYAKQISHNISIGNEWKQYYASAVSEVTLASGQLSYLFHCGFSNQVIEIADVQYLNYKQTLELDDLPVTEITYAGQAADASWRAPAAERIEQHRTGNVVVETYNSNGVLAQGVDVNIEMLQHQFGFGTAVSANEFNNNSTYRNKVLEMFNEIVFENDLKWPQFNPNNTGNISRAMDTLDAHNIPIRGHNIIWPSWRFTPDFLEGLKDDPVALRNAIDKRFKEATTFTRGRLNDWDVMNEPYSEHDVQDVLGDEVMADWFKMARRYDRDVKLYVNDYSILSGGGKNTVKQDYYYNLIQEIESHGAEIDGIGLQGHMSTELTSITKVYEIIDRFAELGKDIKITEHDIETIQRGVQADYTRDFMTILYSHPSVKSLLVWGFWAGRHWKPEAAFFDTDWTIRPHGQVWNDLIYNQWWTPEINAVSDAQGEVSFEGYLGTYKYTISDGTNTRTGTFTIDLSKASGEINRIILSLDDEVPELASISTSFPGGNFICEGESMELSVQEGAGLAYEWYKDDVLLTETGSKLIADEEGSYMVKISKADIELVSEAYELSVYPASEAQITPAEDAELCGGETVLLKANTGEDIEYTWFRNGIQVINGPDELEANATGTYKVMTSKGFCFAYSNEVGISVGTQPEAIITAFGETELCEGDKVTLSANIASFQEYEWFKNNMSMQNENRWIEIEETGSYKVVVSIGNCSDTSDILDVNVYAYPEATISVSGSQEFCEGDFITLSANDGDELLYTWINGSTVLDESDQSVDISEEGSYTLTTTANGCSTTSDAVIITLLSATDPLCVNSIGLNELSANVFPNPCHGAFILEPKNTGAGSTRLSLYNETGKLIYLNEIPSATEQLQIAVPDPGLYLLKLNEGGKEETIKVTVL